MEKDQLNYPQTNVQTEQPTLNAKELLWKYIQYGWLFVLIITLSMLIAWLYLRYTQPIYSVSSTLLIRNDNAKRGGGNSSQDMFADIALFESNTNKQNEILILSSRTMMERVVRSLELQKKYSVVGSIKTTDVYGEQPFELEVMELKDSSNVFTLDVHFSNDWSKFSIGDDKTEWEMGRIVDIPQGKIKLTVRPSVYRTLNFRNFKVSWFPLRDAAVHYASGLQVQPANDLSNVLSLMYTHENPSLGTAILNKLMEQYNSAAIEDKNEMNRKILAFINDRLTLVESQLDSVEGNLQQYRTSRKVIDLASQSELYLGNVSTLSENLRQQEVQLQVAELIEDYLTQPGNKSSLVPSTLGIADPTLTGLTVEYNKLVAERIKEIQTGATLNNPIVRNLDIDIEEARNKMLQSLANIKEVYNRTITSLKNQTGTVNKEILSIPERERTSREKARQQEVKQNLYLFLMQKREESEIAQASTIANSRIIDTALPVYNLVNPIPKRIYLIALIAGIVIPVLLIYSRDILNDKVTIRSDITKITDCPVIGEIGHSEDEKVLLFPNSSRSIVSEQMRILRSNLRFVLAERFENPTILVTSSFSGEGKSFISTNLGATLAISGKKTVILEFDLRKPKILTGLGLSKGHGITNYLVGSARLDELVKPVPNVDGLYVIPCGPVPPNPSEILLTPKIAELFLWLKQEFDAIVIDSAPVGLVSDAFTLSQYANATIYVIRQRYTFKRQLNFIDELYKQKKLPHMGLLVNDVIVRGTSGYYGYGGGRYGYGYGYEYQGSYFEVNDSKKNGVMRRMKKWMS